MTMTDPIADMLTRLRNANVAFHDEVRMPSSKLKEALAQLLEREGYIDGWSVADATDRPGKVLTAALPGPKRFSRALPSAPRPDRCAPKGRSRPRPCDRNGRRQRCGGKSAG